MKTMKTSADIIHWYLRSLRCQGRIVDHSTDEWNPSTCIEITRRRVTKSKDGSQTLWLTLEDGSSLEVRVTRHE